MANFRKIMEVWPILVAFLGVAAAAGAIQVKVSALESHTEQDRSEFHDLDNRLVRVEEAISQLPEIRQDVKELLKRTR